MSSILLLKPVHPVRLQEIEQKYDGAQSPGQRIRPENHLDFRDKTQDDGDVAHPDDAPETEHGEHGHGGFSGAPQNTRDTVGEGEQEVEERDRPCVGRPVSDHLRRAVEGGDQDRYGKVNKDAHKLRRNDRAEDTEARPFFGALVLFCAQILADEGGERHGKTRDGQEAETLDFGVGTAPRHSHFAEFVDV